MTAKERIETALEGRKAKSLVKVSAVDVVAVGEETGVLASLAPLFEAEKNLEELRREETDDTPPAIAKAIAAAEAEIAKPLSVPQWIVLGARRVIIQYRSLRPDILDDDPRLDVIQVAGQLRKLLEAAGA